MFVFSIVMLVLDGRLHWKINMEPKKWIWIEDDFPFQFEDFNMFHVNFQGSTQHDILVEYPINLKKSSENT